MQSLETQERSKRGGGGRDGAVHTKHAQEQREDQGGKSSEDDPE